MTSIRLILSTLVAFWSLGVCGAAAQDGNSLSSLPEPVVAQLELPFSKLWAEADTETSVVAAQQTQKEEGAGGQIIYLDSGEPAPWSGMLIEERDLVNWRLEIESLRFRVINDVEFLKTKCALMAEAEQRLTEIERTRADEKDELWQSRVNEVAGALEETRVELQEAKERGFFEKPIVWFVAGILTTTAIAVGVTLM